MNLDDKIAAFIRKIPDILHEAGQLLEEDFPAYIEAEMHQRKRPSFFNETKTLYSNTPVGGLAESFRTDSDNTASKITIKNGGISASFGSKLPYAAIHESGGFVRSRGKMEGFFWAQYKRTKENYWRVLALSVIKNGGVKMKPRPYLKTALAEYEKTGATQLQEFVLRRATEVFSA